MSEIFETGSVTCLFLSESQKRDKIKWKKQTETHQKLLRAKYNLEDNSSYRSSTNLTKSKRSSKKLPLLLALNLLSQVAAFSPEPPDHQDSFNSSLEFKVVNEDGDYLSHDYTNAHQIHLDLAKKYHESHRRRRSISREEHHLRAKYSLDSTRDTRSVEILPDKPIDDTIGHMTTIYMNISIPNKGEWTMVLKPKPWTVAPSAFIERHSPIENDTFHDDEFQQIHPLSAYRVYGGIIKGHEHDSMVAVTNRDDCMEGYIRISNYEEYTITCLPDPLFTEELEPAHEKSYFYNEQDSDAFVVRKPRSPVFEFGKSPNHVRYNIQTKRFEEESGSYHGTVDIQKSDLNLTNDTPFDYSEDLRTTEDEEYKAAHNHIRHQNHQYNMEVLVIDRS